LDREGHERRGRARERGPVADEGLWDEVTAGIEPKPPLPNGPRVRIYFLVVQGDASLPRVNPPDPPKSAWLDVADVVGGALLFLALVLLAKLLGERFGCVGTPFVFPDQE
jgi:hypothetical protein